jgi:hypothetical protein
LEVIVQELLLEVCTKNLIKLFDIKIAAKTSQHLLMLWVKKSFQMVIEFRLMDINIKVQ